jgi:DnaJ-class molecular chaperone
MSSNYITRQDLEEVQETAQSEKRCPRCRGLGTVQLHGQETDCTHCDGWGSVLI